MDTQQLQKYLQKIIDLEVQVKTAEDSYCLYKSRIDQLGISRLPSKPVYQAPKGGASYMDVGFVFAIGCVLTAIVGGLGWLLDSYHGGGFLIGLLAILLEPILSLLAGICALGTVGMCIYAAICVTKENDTYQENVKMAKKWYEEQMTHYNALVAQDSARVSEERQLLPALKEDADLLDQRRRQAKELLNQYYALGVLKPKYRNLVCAATFLEYLENERCYTLTGHEGCYNLFEEEAQRGIIITQLANISEQLGQIRKNQEHVAEALDDIRHMTNHLCGNIQGINERMDAAEQNQRVQSYYIEQNARDQRAMKEYIIMRDWIQS